MHPPETSSNLLPWSIIVPVMQMSGCFPYRMSKKASLPIFSLPLFLWGVFFELFQFTSFTMIYLTISEVYLTPEVGTIVYIFCLGVAMVVVWTTPFLITIKSTSLAILLSDLSRLPVVAPSPARRWYCRPKTLGFLSSFMFLTMFLTHYITTWGFRLFLEISGVFISCFAYSASRVLPSQLCCMVFGLLGHRLVATTGATVAKVSTRLAKDGTFKCENDLEAAISELCDLDAVIREV